MIIAIPREVTAGERRVALVPESAKRLIAKKMAVVIEAGAGTSACIADAEYEAAGAKIVPDARALYGTGGVVVKVAPPTDAEIAMLKEGSTLVTLAYPLSRPELVKAIAARKTTLCSLDMIPRTTLAQMMDVLSSQATLAGYRAVILAAEALPKFFPMLMTAAGTIAPAKVLVLGAGVAGLQAIATARRLGAVVEAYDVRKVVKEQVESLGARFVSIDVEDAAGTGGYAKEQSDEAKQKVRDALAAHVAKSDAVITTALIPGKKAPLLLPGDMVEKMRAGSVVVDIAAEQGGNCELTKPGERYVTKNGVTIIGEKNLPAQMAVHASTMFSRNMEKLLLHISNAEGELVLDPKDEITAGMVITRGGEIVHPQVMALVGKEGSA